ncbi:hypothetical protein M1278_03150 [Candidatus Marsarchaeota archaeon]|nr:hypothetical protein [Candidatus Marsarchaeota archaeon]
MSGQPSLYKMIEAVLKLDDTYKIFLLSTLYAIFLYSRLFIGINITLEGIYTLTINTFITALANNMIQYHLVRLVLDSLIIIVSFVFYIIGMRKLMISFYKIMTYRLLGVVIALTGFAGWFLIFVINLQLHINSETWDTICVILIVCSYLLARFNSKYKFDKEGKAIME